MEYNQLTPQLKDLTDRVISHPWQLRHLRKVINAELGASENANLASFFIGIHENPSRYSYDGMPLDIVPIEQFAQIASMYDRQNIERNLPVYCTEERPDAIVRASGGPGISIALNAYTSTSGDFIVSFMKNVPLTYARAADGKLKILNELAGSCHDALYACRDLLGLTPGSKASSLILIHDEFGGYNYCHWLLDWLPRLGILRDILEEDPNASLLVPFALLPFHKQAFQAMGVDEGRIVHIQARDGFTESSIECQKFYALSSSGKHFQHALQSGAPWAAKAVRDIFLDNNIATAFPQKIILQRKGTRRMIFDEPGKRLLEKHGFIEMFAENLTVSQQIALFHNAKMIVAAHGAGLANLVFCQPGAKVLEIFPEGGSTAAYYIVANAVGADYACAVAPLLNKDPKKHIRDHDIMCLTEMLNSWLSTAL